MTLHIYDAMAVFRRALDNDPMGRGPRKLVWNALGVSPKDVHIYVFEGRGSKAMRRQLYPGYKERPSSFNDSFLDIVKLLRQCLLHTSAMQVDVDGFEGDDVIAALASQYAGQMPIEIHSVDRDLHQLGVLPGVRVRVNAFTDPPMANKFVRLFKTYVGDPSDKIPGLQGFGKKSWAELNHDRLLEAHQELVLGNARIESFMKCGMKEATAARVCEKNVSELLHNFWVIVGFLPLPANWQDGIKQGVPDKTKADFLLKENRQ